MGMENTDCGNNMTGVTNLFLVGFQHFPEMKPLLFLLFLTMYGLTVAGNALIVATVSTDSHLHSPMYFFLGNLSFLEIWYPTATVPKMLEGLLKEHSTISLGGCITQLHFFGSFTSTECYLLTLMAYDRYVAICHPLHYASLMSHRACIQLAVTAWVVGFIPPFITIYSLLQLQFPDHNKIDHFFCEFGPIISATCSDTSLVQKEVFVMSFAVLTIPFLLIIISYARIVSAILRIPSASGRHKAFSTCSSHLAVVLTYFGTLITMYMVPPSGQSLMFSKALSLIYTVFTPMLNPVIYTLRNKDVKEAMRKALRKKVWLPRL